ncbi:phage major capsid protein [Ligilactobacillus cholophilus]|uniref:phage major capsid protein n=1 Tax=Ligilactobacillus cholophilus TaxID=3050131 RepID=UPI0025AF2120|nr:phage major capsid protein [Ligilactobacillus cholophilus]
MATATKKVKVKSSNLRAYIDEDTNTHVITGKAIVFNSMSEYMGFYEIIEPSALDNVDFSNTLLLYNHKFGDVLARVDSDTLDIEIKEDGVYFTATLADTTLAENVYQDIKSRNLKGCSFQFVCGEDEWTTTEDGEQLRIIKEIDAISELSLTPIPAYSETNCSAIRSLEKEVNNMEESKKEQPKVEPVEEPKKEDKPVEQPKVEPKKEDKKVAKDLKVKIDNDDLIKEIESLKEMIAQAQQAKAEPKEEDKRELDEEPEPEEKTKENVIEPKAEPEEDKDTPNGSKKQQEGGATQMAQVIKAQESKEDKEVRNFENWLKGDARDLTSGQTSTNSDAVLPSQVLSLLKQPNDPSQLASYVNRIAVQAPAGKLPVLGKATARLATTQELKENPNIAEAQIKKVSYDLGTYRGQLPVSNEMVSDYPNITSILSGYVNEVKAQTEQAKIGAVLQTATAKTAASLDDIKGLYNGLLNYGSDRKFVVSASMFNELDTMKDAEGRYLLKEDIASETGRSLFGAELIIVPDEILGNAGDKKMFVGSLKAFVTEVVKDEISMKWEENVYFESVLGVAIRMDVVAGDTDAGYFVTYNAGTPAAKSK